MSEAKTPIVAGRLKAPIVYIVCEIIALASVFSFHIILWLFVYSVDHQTDFSQSGLAFTSVDQILRRPEHFSGSSQNSSLLQCLWICSVTFGVVAFYRRVCSMIPAYSKFGKTLALTLQFTVLLYFPILLRSAIVGHTLRLLLVDLAELFILLLNIFFVLVWCYWPQIPPKSKMERKMARSTQGH